jgi:GT2 family glycosyltransferase
MKLISFILVNFNNSQKSIDCVKSIINNINHDYQIYIVDNDSVSIEKNILKKWNSDNDEIIELIWLNKNIGYFPAISYAYNNNYNTLKNTDYLIIGNNDLIFEKNFFTILSNTNYNNDVFVICPSVINNNGIKQNPHILKKYTYLQHVFLEIYHFSYFFAFILNFISIYFKFRGAQKNKNGSDISQYISIGYGALYILNNNYINFVNYIPDYLFLMNEECALSKLVFDNGGRIYYDKNLIVYHKEHSSIKLFSNKKMYDISKSSYKLSKKYFHNLKIYDKILINEP